MRAICVEQLVNGGCKGDCYGCKLDEKRKPKVIILDDNPLSIASYLEEYGDKFKSEKKK